MNTLIISQVAQIFLAIAITVLILVQGKGKGLSSSIGGSIGFYRSRRGVEKALFITTIVFSILFTANSLLLVFLT